MTHSGRHEHQPPKGGRSERETEGDPCLDRNDPPAPPPPPPVDAVKVIAGPPGYSREPYLDDCGTRGQPTLPDPPKPVDTPKALVGPPGEFEEPVEEERGDRVDPLTSGFGSRGLAGEEGPVDGAVPGYDRDGGDRPGEEVEILLPPPFPPRTGAPSAPSSGAPAAPHRPPR